MFKAFESGIFSRHEQLEQSKESEKIEQSSSNNKYTPLKLNNNLTTLSNELRTISLSNDSGIPLFTPKKGNRTQNIDSQANASKIVDSSCTSSSRQ